MEDWVQTQTMQLESVPSVPMLLSFFSFPSSHLKHLILLQFLEVNVSERRPKTTEPILGTYNQRVGVRISGWPGSPPVCVCEWRWAVSDGLGKAEGGGWSEDTGEHSPVNRGQCSLVSVPPHPTLVQSFCCWHADASTLTRDWRSQEGTASSAVTSAMIKKCL